MTSNDADYEVYLEYRKKLLQKSPMSEGKEVFPGSSNEQALSRDEYMQSRGFEKKPKGESSSSGKKDSYGHVIRNMNEADIMAQPLHDELGGRLVANCKRAQTLGHKVSPKCKMLLSRLEQDRLNNTKGYAADSAQPYSDLKIKFGEGRGKCGHAEQYGSELLESEKYYSDVAIKGLARKENLDPYNSQYEVRAANCYGHRQKGSRYIQAPMFDTANMREQQVKQLLTEFFNDPERFKQTHSDMSYETIVIRSILKEDDEEADMMDSAWGGAGQPFAASESTLSDIPVSFEDIVKTRELIKCSSKAFEPVESKEETSEEKK